MFAPNLAWENVSIQALIAEEFAIPVIIDNEANAGAVGEKQFGAGKSTSNMIYVSLVSGLGQALLLKMSFIVVFQVFPGKWDMSLLRPMVVNAAVAILAAGSFMLPRMLCWRKQKLYLLHHRLNHLPFKN